MKRFKQISQTLLLTIIALFFVAPLNAEILKSVPDFEADGIYYKYNGDGATVSVTFYGYVDTSTGSYSRNTYSGEFIIPSTVQYEGKSYTVTKIDRYAFLGQAATSVTLPTTIKAIGEQAFRKTQITQMYIHEGVEVISEAAFASTPLEEIHLPDGLRVIDNGAFYETQLRQIDIPSGVERIGYRAFNGCSNLTSANIPSSVKSIEEDAFSNSGLSEINMDSSNSALTYIGNHAFGGIQISEIVIPAGVETINPNTFSSCKNLKSVSFGENSKLKTISDEAFRYSGLEDITVPQGLDSIGNYAFADTKLSELVLPEGIRSIGAYFIENTNVTKLNVPSSVEFIGSYAFRTGNGLSDLDYATNTLNVGMCIFSGVKNITIHDKEAWTLLVVTKAPFRGPSSMWGPGGNSGFATVCFNGDPVKEYEIPEGVSLIEPSAFQRNEEIESIIFPNSLKVIGNDAFDRCVNLKYVKFGNSISEIYGRAFDSCDNLETVDICDLANWCQVDFNSVSYYSVGAVPHYNLNDMTNPLSMAGKVVLNGEVLESLNIPYGVNKINHHVFADCNKIISVTIPRSVEIIGDNAFSNCADLEEISFAKNSKLDSIGTSAFANTIFEKVTLPSSLSKIGASAFKGCLSLTSINIPAKVTTIKDNTFNGCKSLTTVTFEEGLKDIGYSAFSGTALTRIDFPQSLCSIDNNAFSGVYIDGSPIDFHVPDLKAWCGVIMGGEYWCRSCRIFVGEDMVTDLVIPEGVDKLGQYLFKGNVALETITLPEGVEEVGSYCFYQCHAVHTIHVPTTLSRVGQKAFEIGYINRDLDIYVSDIGKFVACGMAEATYAYQEKSGILVYGSNLYLNGQRVVDVVIPEYVTELGDVFNSFRIRSVTLPSNLEKISGGSFTYSYDIEYLYCKGKFAASLGSNCDGFYELNNKYSKIKAIYIPAGRTNNYISKWSSNASLIKEAPDDFNFSGEMDASSITEAVRAHASVYGTNVNIVNLSGCTLDDDVTAETLAEASTGGSTIFFLPDGTTGIEGENIVVDGHTTKLTLQDGIDFVSPCDFVADELVYIRKFEKEATTLCVPFDMPALPEGMHAYTMTGQDENGNVVFDEVQTIAANRPYLVIAEKPIDNLQGTNIQFKATPSEMDNAGSEDYEFYGTLSEIPYSDASFNDAYVLDDKMKWVSVCESAEAIDIAAGRAYIIPVDGVDASIGTVFTCDIPVLNVAGDANGDDIVDVTDIVVIANYILGASVGTVNKKTVDVNGDGYVDVTDIVSTANIILHSSPRNAPSIRQQTIDPQ